MATVQWSCEMLSSSASPPEGIAALPKWAGQDRAKMSARNRRGQDWEQIRRTPRGQLVHRDVIQALSNSETAVFWTPVLSEATPSPATDT